MFNAKVSYFKMTKPTLNDLTLQKKRTFELKEISYICQKERNVKVKHGFSDEQLLEAIVEGIKDKKGSEIVSIDVREFGNGVCDYFIICSGTSNTHVSAIARSIEETTWNILKTDALRREGLENALWVLLDYGSVFVHIFQEECRHFYKLEDLWSDGKTVKFAQN